jgi:NADH:ubiquinone oxidoreductase subunit F (NADH-binding)
MGYNVFQTDLDVLWLGNPYPVLKGLLAEHTLILQVSAACPICKVLRRGYSTGHQNGQWESSGQWTSGWQRWLRIGGAVLCGV